MKPFPAKLLVLLIPLLIVLAAINNCSRISSFNRDYLQQLQSIGLLADVISSEDFLKGVAPANFKALSGAAYKPSFNQDPGIPAQCWIETGYGTQNACKYCHTNFLAEMEHGNNFPIADDQIVYSFPSANLNRILWQNIIYPQNIEKRLKAEGIALPDEGDVEYVRHDNWYPTFLKARQSGHNNWLNKGNADKRYILFPALNPRHLFPFREDNPTGNGLHGYINNDGFVIDEYNQFTGWRAVNFFPYAIFTPLSGSVSGIYIRLPQPFTTQNGTFNAGVYARNLDILEMNIKNNPSVPGFYEGDASGVAVKKGFYPVGTEFAHPLHYVDLNADGETGIRLDGLAATDRYDYEFPGTRSKRVKEIRYMYKWKDVNLADIAIDEENDSGIFYGREGQGWVDNGAGWIIAGYIENRFGDLRPQTTEELAQCVGCHAKTGNTIDAVWSFQRKLPGMKGWADMNYGAYRSAEPYKTDLSDFMNTNAGMGEMGYFYYSVIGADLYGVMPNEIRNELIEYARQTDAVSRLGLQFTADEVLDDEALKHLPKADRKPRLTNRQKLMQDFSLQKGYLFSAPEKNGSFIKGNLFYPSLATMKANINGYRKIVLDQSFNLGKDVFGVTDDHVPFTFRSDGTVLDEKGKTIPAGAVIYSRPYNSEGIGITPTGIIAGESLDRHGDIVEPDSPEKVRQTGTLDMYYSPILSDEPIVK